MKTILSILILFSIFLSTTADELPSYLTELAEEYENRMKVWAVTDDDFEDDNDNEFTVIKFQTCQDERDEGKEEYQVRVTVQLTDKKTKTIVYAQATEKPTRLPSNDTYADHTAWEFRIPFGSQQKPKLTACVIEFGFIKDKYFVPVNADYDKVDSAEEIMTGEGSKVDMKCTIRSAHYRYNI